MTLDTVSLLKGKICHYSLTLMLLKSCMTVQLYNIGPHCYSLHGQ